MATGRVPTTANSPLTAKGDLFTYSTAPARLAVGNNGESLVADSSTATGLRYQGSMAAGKNFIINGGMDIWQRGTSIALTSANTYCVDRFIASANTSGAATVSRQATGDTTNLPFIQYCARFQRNAGNTATGIHYFNQPIETINSIPLVGKTVTLSFYARAGANFSASSNLLTAQLVSGTGTDQSYLAAWTGGATVLTVSATLTTTWQRFTATGTVSSTATELTVPFSYTPTGTAGANDYYEVTGVQLEVGSVATQFTRTGGTIAGELAACQRYYYRATANGAFSSMATGQAYTSTNAYLTFYPKTSMRTAPSSVDYSTIALGNGVAAIAAVTALTIETGTASPHAVLLAATVASGLTQYQPNYCIANNSTSAYIGLSAEL